MVHRTYCVCTICDQVHTLRISVGHQQIQEHVFQCVGCGESLKIRLNIDLSGPSLSVDFTENCARGAEEGAIVNLHPNFTIPADQLHTDQSFPWMLSTAAVSKKQHEIMDRQQITPPDNTLQSMKEYQGVSDQWRIIRKAWSLTMRGQDDLAKQQLQEHRLSGDHGEIEFPDALFHFCELIVGPQKAGNIENFARLISEIRQTYSEEFFRFHRYFMSDLYREHHQQSFELFTEYFRDFSEFNQTLLFVQYDLPDTDEAVATSKFFSQTKMFYGNAYEVITSHFTLLACLNNVLNGRRYDQFLSMDLAKYVTIDKANRANPFKENSLFFEFAKGLDSTLRNASHHRAISIDSDHREITYRSGGTGAERQISYACYLRKCNEVFLNEVTLLMFDIYLEYAFRGKPLSRSARS